MDYLLFAWDQPKGGMHDKQCMLYTLADAQRAFAQSGLPNGQILKLGSMQVWDYRDGEWRLQ